MLSYWSLTSRTGLKWALLKRSFTKAAPTPPHPGGIFASPRRWLDLALRRLCDYLVGMYDFTVAAESEGAHYPDLLAALDALTVDEPDGIANLANAAALLWQFVPDLNWAGFYRLVGDELVLGPFQGKVACLRIALGRGVCGTAAAERRTQRVDDVHAFPGHIACDAASRSELVVPILHEGRLLGVLDLDSPRPARFSDADARGCEALMARLAPRLGGMG
jgi:L-methionine (R)-S-oxide reductase